MLRQVNGYVKFLDKKIPQDIKKYYDTPSLQRLKRVGYFCGMDFASRDVYNFKEYLSTYEHSITTAGITSMFTSDKKAILAALYHDVSKPTCSHVVDYMNGDYKTQESTEEFTKDIILGDELLRKYLKDDGIEPEEVYDFKNYSLVDLDRPSLCADRIDGVILSSLVWSETLKLKEAKKMLMNLEAYINEFGVKEIGFKNMELATQFVRQNDIINSLTHSNWDTYMMQLLADIIALAIKEELITYETLYYIDDVMLFRLLEFSEDPNLRNKLTEFENILKEDIKTPANPEIKDRKINPLVGGKRLNKNISLR